MRLGLIPRSGVEEPLCTLPVAARLARVSTALLQACVSEGLVQRLRIAGGEEGLTHRDVRRRSHTRSLHVDPGLDLSAVEVVLRMRERVLVLLEEMQELEMQSARREEVLLGKIRWLQKRVAEESDRR